jgi:microcystin-dependent protein
MSDPYLGEIRMFGGNFAPEDWALCNGQTLSISQYNTLYSLIGTTYGGDGVVNFKLPDLQGRIPVCMSSSYPIGQKAGLEKVTLTEAQMPAHTHAVNAVSATSNQTSPEKSLWASSTIGAFSSGSANVAMNSQNVLPANTGTPQGHWNLMPYLTVSFIICIENGIFPPRG